MVDNFERGLAQATEGDPFAEGMEKIYKQLTTTLESLGVEPIEAVDKEFNPDLHNAVMHVEDESVGDNIIVEELQKGYTYKGFVVRHSMVKEKGSGCEADICFLWHDPDEIRSAKHVRCDEHLDFGGTLKGRSKELNESDRRERRI